MRPLLLRVMAAIAVTCAVLFPTNAVPSTEPAASPPRSGKSVACQVVVRDIVDLGKPKNAGVHAYAVELDALSDQSVHASGTLSLFASDDRYDIAFTDAVARGRSARLLPPPIVVRFPPAVRIDRGHVSSLKETKGASCLTLTREVTPPQTGSRVPAWLGALLERTQDARAIDAPRPRKEARGQCTVVDRRAYARRAAPANVLPEVLATEVGSELGSGGLEVQVVVLLSDNGTVLDAHPAHVSKWPVLDSAAVDAARRSLFVPQVVRCRPQGGEYMFVTTYAPTSI